MSDAARAQYWDGPYEGEDRWRAGRLHPGRIALIVIAFILWWPIGLAVLIYSIWSGRMDCWNDSSRYERKMSRMQEKMDRMRSRMDGRGAGGGGSWWGGRRDPAGGGSSGNRAFDEYRAETLKRLEEEERGFRDFLERLRQAKDKAEFDQFMAERRRVAEPEHPAGA